MIKKYLNILLLIAFSLHADECLQLAPYCSDECLTEDELEAVRSCSKTYNNLVVTNALRTSNLNVTAATTLSGASTLNGAVNVTGTLNVNGLPIEGGLASYGSFSNVDAVQAEDTNANVLWTTDNGSTNLANPKNLGFLLTETGTGTITIQNNGIYLYNFSVALQGAADTTDPQVATAQLVLNSQPLVQPQSGITSLMIPTNNSGVTPTPIPYQLTGSGIIQVTSAPETLALSLNLTPSITVPVNGTSGNAYLTLIQLN